MADQDADTKSNPPDSGDETPRDFAYEHSFESDSKKIVEFPQQANSELELKSIELAQKRLVLEREHFLFEKEKAQAEIELIRAKTELELASRKSAMQLEELLSNQAIARNDKFESKKHQRQQSNRSYWFKMAVSTVLTGAGIWLISRGDNLGPYLLGTGAGGAGIQAVPELMQGRKKEDLESSIPDSRSKETELGA
jgi:hypothetical protein